MDRKEFELPRVETFDHDELVIETAFTQRQVSLEKVGAD